MDYYEDLHAKFEWGRCAYCKCKLTERTAYCVLIYPQEFCSKEHLLKWETEIKK